MKKKGSHVGIILSFVIFVTFLIFLYSILEPAIRMQRDKESLLDYLKIELIKRFSEDLTSSSVSIIEVQQECIVIENLVDELNIPPEVIVKGESGYIFPNKIDGSNLMVDLAGGTGEFFFKIYYSEEFEESSGGSFGSCNKLIQDGTYTIGLVRTDEYVFETKINDLINEYETNYDGLKSELKIPSGSEFGFSLIHSNETRVGTEEEEISTNIYAREIPVQYVDRESNINSGFINILVW